MILMYKAPLVSTASCLTLLMGVISWYSCDRAQASGEKDCRHPIGEASGVARGRDGILIVDDDRPNMYFQVDTPTETVTRISADEVMDHQLPTGSVGIDLESIDTLADGRVVVLSESARALVSDEGVVAEYPAHMGEVGTRGLEGLAVLEFADSSKVAVVWEGGFLRREDLPIPLQPYLPDSIASVDATVLVHSILDDTSGIEVEEQTETQTVTLRLPVIASHPSPDSSFRVADLVWHKLDEDRWGFIALLNSYQFLWLQRFDYESGEAVGDPIDLSHTDSIPEYVRRKKPNWEGLEWYEEGESLILIDDEGESRGICEPPYLLLLRLPTDWRADSLKAH